MSTAITQELPKEKWRAYFDTLADRYQSWAITIEALDRELGDQTLADGLPLQGISFETAGSQAGDLLIEAGDAGTPFRTHLVHRPRIVRIASTQPGADVDVEIESEDGVTTLVRLRPLPALPPAGRN
jgi:hypothetical protein